MGDLAPVLMVQGTASSVGKSVLVTALCRIFRQDGIDVAPFKAQNMSNNADVTPDGLEIGRAQSEQAAAAGVTPSVEMNPVLLKPQADHESQLVLNGRPAGVLRSSEFLERKRDLWPHVERALTKLRSRYELIVAEGAGSPAEPNLRAGDIVNMRVARHAGATVLLAGDIDRGSVFAHLLGTLELLEPADRPLVRGFLINRFRGDPRLLDPALVDIEERTGVPVLGVVPWIRDLAIAEEDAVALERGGGAGSGETEVDVAMIDIAVIHHPRIANFDEFAALGREPGVGVRYVESASGLGSPDLIVLPGTKATIADLAVLRERGLDAAIVERAQLGCVVLGVCGGFQMLGTSIVDELGVEAKPGTRVQRLGLLPVETRFEAAKETRRVSGSIVAGQGPFAGASGLRVEGYEIHMGQSEGDCGPLLEIEGRPSGAVSADGQISGAYVHGLLENDALRRALLGALGRPGTGGVAPREAAFDQLADVVRAHVDVERVKALVFGDGGRG